MINMKTKTVNEWEDLLAEEPPLELDFPRVFVQPRLESCSQGKKDIPRLLKKIEQSKKERNGETFTEAYNELVVEFRPILNWAHSCWDYLLTTQGVRYLMRPEGEKLYCHGDYRAFTDRDFHRLIYKVFKECILDCAGKNNCKNFILYLKKNFWKRILEEYNKLENPPDPKQRKLTPYSYLRCVPYEFMNRYHQERVEGILKRLKCEEQEIVKLYFLNFYRIEEILRIKNLTPQAFQNFKKDILYKIACLDTLVYSLLLQIERY
ncbi:MAG: hypothetical protein NC834_04875 [Candidatus Omnitrophica bacterium]|nr:hypothetical protein [Candidatus Omnitrophota bacterium]